MDYIQPFINNKGRNGNRLAWIYVLTLPAHNPRNWVLNKVAFGLLLSLILFAWFFYHLDNYMPKQLSVDYEFKQPERFVGERADWFMQRLCNIGPRVVGSHENEVVTVGLLRNDLDFIKAHSKNKFRIDVDVQKSTGSYDLTLGRHTFRNYYDQVQSLVVRFTCQTCSRDSILINCHFDTVPNSEGAGDDGLNCGVLIEVLQKLSQSEDVFLNSIIFLFNGAEETPLQASHGFITQHKWKKDVKAVINLDSAGAGGQEVLFQTTTNCPWLVKMYAKVAPHPTGGVHAEELFLSGLVPSDTDFRIFKTFGKIPGLDFAHIGNGYTYHTKYDKLDNIDTGVIQSTGDNMLALIREIALTPDFGKLVTIEHNYISKVVYFDVFGLYMFAYTETTAYIVNLGSAFLSFASIHRAIKFLPESARSIKTVLFVAKKQFMGWLFSGLMVIFTAKICDLAKTQMSWYNKMWLVVPLYFTIFTFVNAVPPLKNLGRARGVKAEKKAMLYLVSVQLIWTTILILGTILGIRSSFIILFLVIPATISSTIATFRRTEFSSKFYIKCLLAILFLPLLYIIHQTVRIFNAIIPMTGRMGPESQPELIICAVVITTASLTMSYLIPLVLTLKRPRVFMFSIFCVYAGTVLLVINTPVGFPYSSGSSNPAPQRFYLMHTQRKVFDEKQNLMKMDYALFMQPLDKNGFRYISKSHPAFKGYRTAVKNCLGILKCGVPIFSARNLDNTHFGIWIKANRPVFPKRTNLLATSETIMNNGTKRINFVLAGPDHMNILICPKPGVNLSNWNFDTEKPQKSSKWITRDVYMISYTHGLNGGILEFSLDFETTGNLTKSVVDIGVISHHVNTGIRSDDMTEFMEQLPDWAHVTAWTVSSKYYVF